ncbi:prepilin-type N-terminal cleavage/methylation domain-containing protein [bacterium CPR1]|nr:prepilin-type N-terminal cleavage/methylation domain-containing protein [bacterium CPR1]
MSCADSAFAWRIDFLVLDAAKRRGLSLLELMVTIVLLSTVLIAFAAVYPAGYKLNRKSQRATQAAQLATAVAEEVRQLPFDSVNPAQASLFQLSQFTQSGVLPPAGVIKTELKPPFMLPDASGGNAGIPLGIRVLTPNIEDGYPRYADIEVTIAWDEPNERELQRRHVTVKTSRTENRY